MEIQIYLAKFMPDLRRAEPRNVGLVIRTSSDELWTKFLLKGEHTERVPRSLDIVEYAEVVVEWKKQLSKYGVKALNWVGKRASPRKKDKFEQKYYLEFMGGEFVGKFDGEIDLNRLFEELVL